MRAYRLDGSATSTPPLDFKDWSTEVPPIALKIPQYLAVIYSPSLRQTLLSLLNMFVDKFQHLCHSSIYFCARWCLWKWSCVGIPQEVTVEQRWALFSRSKWTFMEMYPTPRSSSPSCSPGRLFLVFPIRINSCYKYLAANLRGELPHCIRPPCWQRGWKGPSAAD